MNPLGIACIALSSGCGYGLVVLLNHLRVAQDAVPAPAPVVEDPWDGEWAPMVAEVNEELKARQKARQHRVDTLRNIYLADLAAAVEEPVEVSAR